MVERGLAPSRSQARDLILRGQVRLAGATVSKPGALVADDAMIEVEAGAYVSRGGVKLAAALDAFGFTPEARVILDIGASTGGFTQVLLKRGAARVYAVDVGHGQLHASLAGDPRVVSLERCDARTLTAERVEGPIGAIVADVSFISLTQALPAALALAAPGAWLVALVKPQFEVGRAGVGKGGIVRDAAIRAGAVEKVRNWLASQPGWQVVDVVESPIVGGSGNQEFLIGARRDG